MLRLNLNAHTHNSPPVLKHERSSLNTSQVGTIARGCIPHWDTSPLKFEQKLPPCLFRGKPTRKMGELEGVKFCVTGFASRHWELFSHCVKNRVEYCMAHRRIEVKAIKNARALRSNMTDAEVRLWQALRMRQLQDARFRRQHAVGPYIVDFCAPQKKLIIEIDGG